MAKKKIVPEEIEASVDVIEEVKVEKKNEEKPQVLSSKEKICEFYGIQDREILDKNNDLSKYELKDDEKAILKEWAEESSKGMVKDVTFDFYTCSEEVRAIMEKYGVLPEHVAEWKMADLWLSKDEQEIIENYYNERAVEKRANIF